MPYISAFLPCTLAKNAPNLATFATIGIVNFERLLPAWLQGENHDKHGVSACLETISCNLATIQQGISKFSHPLFVSIISTLEIS